MFMKQHKTKDILNNAECAFFALGSRSYPHFCESGYNVDYSLGNLGTDQIISCNEGDELSGQDKSFHEWSQNCFMVIYFFMIKLIVNLGNFVVEIKHNKQFLVKKKKKKLMPLSPTTHSWIHRRIQNSAEPLKWPKKGAPCKNIYSLELFSNDTATCLTGI